MNTLTRPLALALAIAAAPHAAHAQRDGSDNDAVTGGGFEKYLTGKNIGRVLGAGVGALLGSQVGGGDGKLAAVAIGTLAGFWLGGEAGEYLNQRDRAGIAQTTQTALDTGQDQTWTNPETGVATKVVVHDKETVDATGVYARAPSSSFRAPPLDLINAYYVATTTSNVRAGPGTHFAERGQLQKGQRVAVIGKVKGDSWMMIAQDGIGSGYVYASLLTPAGGPMDDNAVRHAAREAGSRTLLTERTCANLTQEIALPNGTAESKRIRACQRADGTWEAV